MHRPVTCDLKFAPYNLLLFDKIVCYPGGVVPGLALYRRASNRVFLDVPDTVTDAIRRKWVLRESAHYKRRARLGKIGPATDLQDSFQHHVDNVVWFSRQYAMYGINAVPVFTLDYKVVGDIRLPQPAGAIGFQAVLNRLRLVDADSLHLDQVLEFRRDDEAVTRYRAIRMWLTQALSATSVAEAEDIIAARIADYNWALDKHGLQSVEGALTSILNAKYLVPASGVATITTLLSGPLWGLVAAGVHAAGNVVAWAVRRHIAREDYRRHNLEVACLHEIERFAEKPRRRRRSTI